MTAAGEERCSQRRAEETGSHTHEEESLGQWPQTSDSMPLVDFSL